MRASFALAALLAAALAAPPAQALTADEARTRSFELLNEGVRLYKQGDFRKAEERLAESFSIHLNSFQAAYYLGLARLGARRHAQAVEPLEVALDFKPDDLPARVALGEAHLGLGDLASARTEFYRALEVREDFSPAYDGLARLAEASGDTDRARELFRQAIAADRGDPDPHIHLGMMALRLGRMDEALQELEEAVLLRADYPKALDTLARVQLRLGRTNEALASATRAADIAPGNPAHHEALGRVYLPLGDYRRAEAAFRDAIERDEDHVEAWDGLALALRAQGRFVEAAETVEEIAGRPWLVPRVAEELLDRAALYRLEGGRLERLRGLALADGGMESVSPLDLADLARLSASVEDWDTAARAAERAAAAEPAREDLARLRAYYLLRAGRVLDAREAYRRLTGGEGARGDDLVNLGVAETLLGNDAGALEAYGRSRLSDEPPAEAELYLATVLERTGDRDGAREALKRYLDRVGPTGASSARARQFLARTAPPTIPVDADPFGGAEAGAEEDSAGEKGKKKRKKKERKG